MSVPWIRVQQSLLRVRTVCALHPFSTKSRAHCENHPGKSWKKHTQQGTLTKDKKYKEVMTAKQWAGDLMAHKKEAGDVITGGCVDKDVITKPDEHSDVITASKEKVDLAEPIEYHGDIIAAPEDHHSVMPPIKEQKDVIHREKESLDIATLLKDQRDLIQGKKEHKDMVMHSKEHLDVTESKPEPANIMFSKEKGGDVIASMPEHHDVMARTENPGAIMTASNLHGDLKKETKSEDSYEEASQLLHIPVMSTEVLELMNPQDGQIIFDLTFGAGGHTKQILGRAPGCTVYALDRDPQAHQMARELADQYEEGRIIPLLGRFSEVPALLSERGVGAGSAHAVLMDLGASSMQFDQPVRGFRLSADGPLDMRMDGDRLSDQMTAADVVNTLDEVALARIISRYGEEKHARSIATAIVESRYAFGDITTTCQLIKIINSVFSEGYHRQDKLRRHSHVATKTFQALRIFVNDELNELSFALKLSHRLLTPKGVCLAISFHSLEDRLVKRAFSSRLAEENEKPRPKVERNFDKKTMAEAHFFKPVTTEDLEKSLQKKWTDHEYFEPSIEEVATNPRARSAKLRVARKL